MWASKYLLPIVSVEGSGTRSVGTCFKERRPEGLKAGGEISHTGPGVGPLRERRADGGSDGAAGEGNRREEGGEEGR